MHAAQQRSIATTTPRSAYPHGPLERETPVAWWTWNRDLAVPLPIEEGDRS